MSEKNTLPSFVVVGASKCGTTSLYHYLSQYPDIYLPVQKELHYFSCKQLDANCAGPGDQVALKDVCRSLEEYQSHYKGKKSKIAGDISPSYFYYSSIAGEMKKQLGDVKIIIMLRNPIEKAYSQYMHLVREAREDKNFMDALDCEGERRESKWSDIWLYSESGKYFDRVKDFIDVFGVDNVRVVVFEEFALNAGDEVKAIAAFIGADSKCDVDTSRILNRTGKPKSRLLATFMNEAGVLKSLLKILLPPSFRLKIRFFLMDFNTADKPKIDDEVRSYLKNIYKHDIERLEQLLGRSLPWKN